MVVCKSYTSDFMQDKHFILSSNFAFPTTWNVAFVRDFCLLFCDYATNSTCFQGRAHECIKQCYYLLCFRRLISVTRKHWKMFLLQQGKAYWLVVIVSLLHMNTFLMCKGTSIIITCSLLWRLLAFQIRCCCSLCWTKSCGWKCAKAIALLWQQR